jgi:integrase/recombinase XerD
MREGKEMKPNPPNRHGNGHADRKERDQAKRAELLLAYENDLASCSAPHTVISYLLYTRQLLTWLDGRGLTPSEVRTADLQAYRTALSAIRQKNGKPYSVAAQTGKLAAAKRFFRFLFRHGDATHDPAASIELPRRDRRLPRVLLTPSEVNRVIEGIRERTPLSLRDRAFLETLYATGLRVSELAKLTPADVDFEDGTIRVLLGKGSKDRYVPLTEPAAEAIDAYIKAGRPVLVARTGARYLFVAEKGGYFHCALVNLMLRQRTRAARITKYVTCHTFRHSVATHLLRGGADIRHIQAILGHAYLSSTQIYTHVELSDLKRAVSRAHPRGK